MKKKTKKNQTTDCLTVPFSNYLKFSKEYEFIKMAKNGADTLPFFKETWDFIEKNLENDDRYINVLIPFMTTYLHIAMLEEDKKLREKYIWSIWYYLKLDEPLLICHFQKESEQLILEVEQQIHQILEGDYPEFLEVLEEKKKDNTVIK
jgi:hypothetical protein